MQVTNTSGDKYDYGQVLMNRGSPGLQDENGYGLDLLGGLKS